MIDPCTVRQLGWISPIRTFSPPHKMRKGFHDLRSKYHATHLADVFFKCMTILFSPGCNFTKSSLLLSFLYIFRDLVIHIFFLQRFFNLVNSPFTGSGQQFFKILCIFRILFHYCNLMIKSSMLVPVYTLHRMMIF